MIEVHPRLHVGNALDWERHVKAADGDPKPGWNVVHCAKEPYHRQALGYTGMSGPRDHKEYLVALRGNGTRLCLNMVDAPKPEFFRDEMILHALEFIRGAIAYDARVLVHCNQGASRAPSLALLYLRRFSDEFDDMNFADAEDMFRGLYPAYQPGAGIRGYVQSHWG